VKVEINSDGYYPYCPQCYTEVDEEQAYCPKCGVKLYWEHLKKYRNDYKKEKERVNENDNNS
jgi:rRNA maturation endonuclease Nob1